MNRQKIYVGESFYSFREMEYDERWDRCRRLYNAELSKNYGLICPICNEEFVIGETVYMIITNKGKFPNTVIHKKCSNNLEETVSNLTKNYNNYLETIKKFRAWF